MKKQFIGLSLDFRFEGGIAFSSDPDLHKLAIEFSQKELAKQFNFTDAKKVFVVCEVDEAGKPIRVCGLSAIVFKPDVPVLRFVDANAGEVLIERMRSYLEDLGYRGYEALISLGGGPEITKCPKWRRLLRKVRAEKAPRWSVTV